MPEESFEEQARRKAESFRMEPKPDVWRNVATALAPEKRRRKAVFWWWLLPLCAGTILSVILVANRSQSTINKADKMVASAADTTAEETELLRPSGADWNELKQGKITSGKAQQKSAISDAKKIDKAKEASSYYAAKINSFEFVSPNKNSDPVIANSSTVSDFIAKMIQPVEEKKETLTKKDEIDINKEIVRTGSEHTDNNDSADVTISGSKLIVLPAHDSSFGKPTTNEQTKIKKKTDRKWQVGIMPEIGVVSWAKGFFVNNSGNQAYLDGQAVTSPDSPVNSGTGDSTSIGNNWSRQTRNGIDAAMALSIRKAISNRFYFDAQFGYRYQQYQVSNYEIVSVQQPTVQTVLNFIKSDEYHAHFLTLNTAAGFCLFRSKRNALSAEFGMDNNILLIMKQQEKAQSSTFFTQVNADNFRRWQPQISLSLPFDWHSGKSLHFQVAPFARFGLRSYEKSSKAYQNNRLVSAGLQATYFFK